MPNLEKISRVAYRDAQRCEEISDCCWKLCDLLGEGFVGYEDDISRLTSLAIEFGKMFDDKVAPFYEC